jgi:heavy metal-binding protein
MRLVRLSAAIALALLLAVSGVSSQGRTYWCPMHPDVRGEAGAKCPLCGMALVPGPAALDAYWLDVAAGTPPPVAGRAQRLRFLVRDPHTGAPVRSFTLLHERLLHLFIVSHDLTYFSHVHPEIERDGTFEQSITLPKPGAYRLIADFAPEGAAPQLLQKTIVTAGYRGSLRAGAAPAVDTSDKAVDGTRITLVASDPIAGREQLMTFEIADAASGKPVADLEPFLGAPGHLLIVGSDLLTATHSHPVAELSGNSGPEVVFQVLFPRPGVYRMWVQFQRHGRVTTAPFTVRAIQK